MDFPADYATRLGYTTWEGHHPGLDLDHNEYGKIVRHEVSRVSRNVLDDLMLKLNDDYPHPEPSRPRQGRLHGFQDTKILETRMHCQGTWRWHLQYKGAPRASVASLPELHTSLCPLVHRSLTDIATLCLINDCTGTSHVHLWKKLPCMPFKKMALPATPHGPLAVSRPAKTTAAQMTRRLYLARARPVI